MGIELSQVAFDFFKQIYGKKIVLFGAGRTAGELLNNFNLDIAYIVDNEKTLWGTDFWGYEVKDPEELNKEDKNNIVVIVAVTDWEVNQQLKGFGLKDKKQILASPLMLDSYSITNFDQPKLIVSCSGLKGGVYTISFGDKPQIDEVYSGNCRGLVFCDGFYYVAVEHKGILKLDSKFNLIKEMFTPENFDLHGITIDPQEGILYVNETKYDRIGIYDCESLERKGEIDIKKTNSDLHDQHHINDVSFKNGKLYVSMFSINGVWQQGILNDGAIVTVDTRNKEIETIAIGGLIHPHSLLLNKNNIYYCNSKECNVFWGDRLLCQFNGYLRGLARWRNLFYIGQSKARRLSTFSDRFSNISMDTGIHVWNQLTKTSNFIHVPVEQIFDIFVSEN